MRPYFLEWGPQIVWRLSSPPPPSPLAALQQSDLFLMVILKFEWPLYCAIECVEYEISMISTKIKAHLASRDYTTLSKEPQIHNWFFFNTFQYVLLNELYQKLSRAYLSWLTTFHLSTQSNHF